MRPVHPQLGGIMINRNENRTPLLIITLIYTLAYGLLLLNNSIFWDDWVLFNQQPETVLEIFRMAGAPWTGYTHVFLLSVGDGVLSYRLLVFFCYLISGVCLYFVLRFLKLSVRDCFFITSLFLLFPVNSARIALINGLSAVGYMLFYLGWLLMVQYMRHARISWQVGMLAVFFMAFTLVPPLVFLYSLPVAMLYYHLHRFDLHPERCGLFILKHLDLLVLPVFWWVIKTIYFVPSGIYADYNKLSFGYFPKAAMKTFTVFRDNIAPILLQTFTIKYFWFTITLAIIGIFIFAKLWPSSRVSPPGTAWKWALLGLFIVFISSFPYYMAEKPPGLMDWDSRHQQLLPLGVSLAIYGLVRLLRVRSVVESLLLSFILAAMISQNLFVYLAFQADAYKQASLIANIRANETIRQKDIFVFVDKVPNLNANSRDYRYYEYNGIMKLAFGQSSRIAFDKHTREFKDLEKLIPYKQYNMDQYAGGAHPSIKIYILPGDVRINNSKEVLKLKALEIFDPTAYNDKAQGIIRLEEGNLQ